MVGRGKLDRGKVWSAVDRHLPRVRRCYVAALTKTPNVAGVIELKRLTPPGW